MVINSTKEAANGILNNAYNSLLSYVPLEYHPLVVLGFYVILIAIYSLFIWKFYRFLAKRDIIGIDLAKYNKSTHPGLKKFFAALLFLLNYIVMLPFFIFFWFAVLSLFLLLLAKNQQINQVVLISAAVIGAIRITSYISEDLSKDLSKMLPFTLLGFFLIDPGFFSVEGFFSRLSEIPRLFQIIWMYLIFIFAFEAVLRGLFLIVDLFRSKSRNPGEDK